MANSPIVNSQPQGTEAPPTLDNYIRAFKIGVQERLNVDHYMPASGGDTPTGTTTWETEANDAGKHRQVAFQAVLADDPSAGDGEGILYTLSVDDAVELCWEVDGSDPRQLTKAGRLALVEADFAEVVTEDSILTWTGGVLSLAVDDDTIEYDEGLKIKVPEAGADATEVFAPVMATGHYSGNGNSAEWAFDVGFTIRRLEIKGTSGTNAPVMVQTDGSATKAYGGSGGNWDGSVALVTDGFKLTTANVAMNGSGVDYVWTAIGVRT